MNYYYVPADYQLKTLDEYARLNREYPGSQVAETYGCLTQGNLTGGNRKITAIPSVNFQDLKEYVHYSSSKGIGFNYTMNSTCLGNIEFSQEYVHEVHSQLEQLYSIGVRNLTVSLPSLIDIIRASKLDFNIKISICSQVNTPNKALRYQQRGIRHIVADEMLNRDFLTLRQIVKAFHGQVEIIVNSLCHMDCIYRNYHCNHTSHNSISLERIAETDYYDHKCHGMRAESPEEWLKLCWVRPEDIPYYNKIGIHHFKLQGRHTVLQGDPVRTLVHYFTMKFDGNLIELCEMFGSPYHFMPYIDNRRLDGFIDRFYKEPKACVRNCGQCFYCKRFAQRCMDITEVKQMNEMANIFYKQYDHFTRMLNQDENRSD